MDGWMGAQMDVGAVKKGRSMVGDCCDSGMRGLTR